jgi:hypothetical protein
MLFSGENTLIGNCIVRKSKNSLSSLFRVFFLGNLVIVNFYLSGISLLGNFEINIMNLITRGTSLLENSFSRNLKADSIVNSY